MRAIGNTPLIKLNRLSEPGCAEIYVKYEGANPTGSMKDRMALSMIEGAEKGYRAHFVSSDAFAEEKLQTMRAFGAYLDIIPSENGKITARLIDSLVERARDLSKEPNTFWTDQFNNIDNRNAYHTMAREILDVLGNNIDEFITGVGTGGSFSGNSEVFKKEMPNIRCIAIEPFHVRSLSGGEISGKHKLEGMGAGFVPSICRLDL